jgi:hypothetical protein
MTANFFNSLNKNILILLLSLTAITACSDDPVEDLSLSIKVNKNHIELQLYTSCVDNIEYIDQTLFMPNLGLETKRRIFCLYDSNQRPVEENIFEYTTEDRIDPTPKIQRYLEWNDSQEKLTISTYARDDEGWCEEDYCQMQEVTIYFQ